MIHSRGKTIAYRGNNKKASPPSELRDSEFVHRGYEISLSSLWTASGFYLGTITPKMQKPLWEQELDLSGCPSQILNYWNNVVLEDFYCCCCCFCFGSCFVFGLALVLDMILLINH